MRHAQLTPDKYLLPRELEALEVRLRLARYIGEQYLSSEPSKLGAEAMAVALRDVTYLELLVATGMRASEALNLEPRDLIGGNSIHVRTLKQGMDRIIKVPDALYASLVALSQAGPPFPVSLRRIEQVWHEIRPVKKKLHSLRHTFGRMLYRETKDLELVKYSLGHSSVTNTMIYVLSDRQYDLASALDQMRGAS